MNESRSCRAALALALLAACAPAALSADEGGGTDAAPLVLVLDCVSAAAERDLARTVSGIAAATVAASGEYRAVSPESRDRALEELAFALSDLADDSARARLGSLTAARYALTAELGPGEGELYLVLGLVDVESGELVSSVAEAYRSRGTLVDGVEGQVRRCLGLEAEVEELGSVRVRNAAELVRAIGPDRVVRLAPGRYDLTELYLVRNRYVEWVDEYDGPCPVVKNVSNLALVGEEGAEIVIAPAYGWVLSFETCTGIRVSGLTIGHTKPGFCLGGVLRFARCDDVEIRSCDLYGSGTYGLGLERTRGFSIAGSTVRDCSYGLATVERCEDLLFEDSRFVGSGEFDLFSVVASSHVLWRRCEISGNAGTSLFSVDAESRDVLLSACRFVGNRCGRFSYDEGRPELEAPTFRGNSFPSPRWRRR